MRALTVTLAAAATSVVLATAASAMPVQNLAGDVATPKVDQVRWVCNRWGRCWHVPNWRYHYGYYGYGYGRPWAWRHHRHWW